MVEVHLFVFENLIFSTGGDGWARRRAAGVAAWGPEASRGVQGLGGSGGRAGYIIF